MAWNYEKTIFTTHLRRRGVSEADEFVPPEILSIVLLV